MIVLPNLSTWPVIDNSIMLPNSTCSTLALLFAFSRCPSIPFLSGGCYRGTVWLIFPRSGFSRHFGAWCLFPSSWAKHFFGHHPPSELLLVFLHPHLWMTSARVCFPLLPAVDDAAFVYSLLLVFGSCSVPVSLNSCGADAAVVFLMSHSFLCNSSGNATCISSLLRSNLSLPCGGILRHSSSGYGNDLNGLAPLCCL